MSSNNQEETLRKEIEYYKDQVNNLSKNIIGLQYHLAELTHEAHQMKNGLKLIANLKDVYSLSNDFDFVYSYFSESIVVQMNLDCSLVLTDSLGNGKFTAQHIRGFSEQKIQDLEGIEINIDKDFMLSKKSLLVNSQTVETEFIRLIRNTFNSKYFILTPVLFNNRIISFLFAGRKTEVVPLASSRLMNHDLQTLEAISGILSALKKQFEEINIIETERSRIAKELHDDIGSELTTIRLLSQSLMSKVDQTDETGKKIKRISEAGKNVLESVSEIIWSMNHRNDNLESLCVHIRRFVSDILEIKGISYQLEFPDDYLDLNLNEEFRRNIFLVVKEAMNNIVKHAEATQVRMVLSCSEKEFQIQIIDNGIGIEKQDITGNGLINMKQRIQGTGGVFHLHSDHSGTKISININWEAMGYNH